MAYIRWKSNPEYSRDRIRERETRPAPELPGSPSTRPPKGKSRGIKPKPAGDTPEKQDSAPKQADQGEPASPIHVGKEGEDLRQRKNSLEEMNREQQFAPSESREVPDSASSGSGSDGQPQPMSSQDQQRQVEIQIEILDYISAMREHYSELAKNALQIRENLEVEARRILDNDLHFRVMDQLAIKRGRNGGTPNGERMSTGASASNGHPRHEEIARMMSRQERILDEEGAYSRSGNGFGKRGQRRGQHENDEQYFVETIADSIRDTVQDLGLRHTMSAPMVRKAIRHASALVISEYLEDEEQQLHFFRPA